MTDTEKNRYMMASVWLLCIVEGNSAEQRLYTSLTAARAWAEKKLGHRHQEDHYEWVTETVEDGEGEKEIYRYSTEDGEAVVSPKRIFGAVGLVQYDDILPNGPPV